MPNTRDLRRRIRSVKNTAQITKAMQMVSATKMRRAQNQALAGRPYTSTILSILSLVSSKSELSSHPLMQTKTPLNLGLIAISSDKGLCGALNTNITRSIQTNPAFKNDAKVSYFTIGKKVRDFIVRTKRNLTADFPNPEKVSISDAISIRKMLVEEFTNNNLSEVYILFPDYISTLRQEPRLTKLLPIDDLLATTLKYRKIDETLEKLDQISEFIFEPAQKSLLDIAITHLLDIYIYQALLETKASEHSARMMAMQNATNNAKDLVSDLTLSYNQVRQEGITRELLEIISATAAFE